MRVNRVASLYDDNRTYSHTITQWAQSAISPGQFSMREAAVRTVRASRAQGHPQHLTVRKVDGKDPIHYLRGRVYRAEFSERKHTALWNTKVSEAKAISVSEHLAEGCSWKGTARLVAVDPSTERRAQGGTRPTAGRARPSRSE